MTDPSGLIKITVEGVSQCWSRPTSTGLLDSSTVVGTVAGVFVGEAERVSGVGTAVADLGGAGDWQAVASSRPPIARQLEG